MTTAVDCDLEAGWVDLWLLDLDSRPRGRAILSDDERARADRFHRAEDARRWSAARSSLRSILASYARRAPGELSFTLGAHDKPILEPGDGEVLHFNLSHSKDVGLVAVSRSYELGVDVEHHRSSIDHLSIAERVLSPDAVAIVRRAQRSDLPVVFSRAWVRAEASLKCEGLGLAAAGGTADRSIRVHDLDLGEGFAAALALRDPGLTWDPSRVRCRRPL